MAYELAHNGTRPGGMTRPGARNARDHRNSIENDISGAYLKRASIRLDRRASRAEVALEVADCLSNGEAAGAGTHWLACEQCLAFREYEQWLEDARFLDKAGKSWGVTRVPVNHCLQHDFAAWMDAQYAEDDRWDRMEYAEWLWQRREYERDCDEVDVAFWWVTV